MPILYKAMELKPVETLPEGRDWSYEPKLDGYRMLGSIATEGAIELRSRHDVDFTQRFPKIIQQLPLALQGNAGVVDGEMVGLDMYGKPNRYLLAKRRPPARYYIFDLLELNGEPLVDVPLRERRRQLNRIFEEQSEVKIVHPYNNPAILVPEADQLGFEGIVAKRLSARYVQGKSTDKWVKYKFAGR